MNASFVDGERLAQRQARDARRIARLGGVQALLACPAFAGLALLVLGRPGGGALLLISVLLARVVGVAGLALRRCPACRATLERRASACSRCGRQVGRETCSGVDRIAATARRRERLGRFRSAMWLFAWTWPAACATCILHRSASPVAIAWALVLSLLWFALAAMAGGALRCPACGYRLAWRDRRPCCGGCGARVHALPG